MKRFSIITTCLLALTTIHGQTLQECQQAAERNFPLIVQRELIARTAEATTAGLRNAWLPQISATAQATLQSDVAAWPSEMQSLISQMGLELKGLKKDQYRIGIDVTQTLYDGGSISSQTEVARRQADVQSAQNEVNLYAVHRRVNEMYFGLLMLDEQIRLKGDLRSLLESNENKLASQLKHGAVAESDYNKVRAERLAAEQQIDDLAAQRHTLARLLGTLCGIGVEQVQKPAATQPSAANHRPELALVDAQLRLADAQQRSLDAALRPRISLFAQGFYGFPGYNLFDDMMHHRWSFGGMIGARVSWNIGALYNRRCDKTKLQLQRLQAENSRDLFLLDNRLDSVQHSENIDRYRKQAQADNEIIALRTKVRKAAESKLQHGIFDVNDLVKEINNENAARIQQAVHELQMLKEIYDLKYTLNN